MPKALQITSQIVFLLLFVILVITGKVQLWMGIFVLSVILALLFGRFYCGWLCPINTVMKTVTGLKNRLSLKGLKAPSFLTKPLTRYIVLLIFALTFIFVMATGKKLPVLPALLACGVILTFLFPESLWHRYLCPYGTILSLTGSKAKLSLKIDADNCIQCGICQKVCPAQAVKGKDTFSIDKGSCLLCLDCLQKCPKKAIKYSSRRNPYDRDEILLHDFQ